MVEDTVDEELESIEVPVKKSVDELEKLQAAEKILFAIDRQIITEGIRLVMILPAVVILFLFSSWAYAGPSPSWWLGNIEPALGFDFSTTMAALALVVTIGFTLSLMIHRRRSLLTRDIFFMHVERSKQSNRPVTSLHGYDSLKRRINGLMNRHSLTVYLSLGAFAITFAVIFVGTSSPLGRKGILSATSLISIAVGQHLFTRRNKFHMVERSGMLSAYEPPMHPSTLNMVFNEMMRTHMDPLLRSDYEDFLIEIIKHISEDITWELAVERVIIIMYRRQRGDLNRETMMLELGEVLDDSGVAFVINHEVFSEEMWEVLFDITSKKCPSFYRMVDRMEQDIATGKRPPSDNLLFDVDLENVVSERANLFCFFHNISDKPRDIVLRVQSPDFRPNDLAIRYHLKPGGSSGYPNGPLPISIRGDEDQIGAISSLLLNGTVAWQTLLPEHNGEATVSVRLEDPSGDLLEGRQINVRVRSEFRSLLRETSSLVCTILGSLGIGVAILLQILELFSAV
jgi:hypothetical protein